MLNFTSLKSPHGRERSARRSHEYVGQARSARRAASAPASGRRGLSRRAGSRHARVGEPRNRPRRRDHGSAPRHRLAPAVRPLNSVGTIAASSPLTSSSQAGEGRDCDHCDANQEGGCRHQHGGGVRQRDQDHQDAKEDEDHGGAENGFPRQSAHIVLEWHTMAELCPHWARAGPPGAVGWSARKTPDPKRNGRRVAPAAGCVARRRNPPARPPKTPHGLARPRLACIAAAMALSGLP